MTTHRIIAAIALGSSIFASYASDLTMSAPDLVGIKEVTTKHVDNQTGQPFDAHWKDYTFTSLLKNVSDKPIIVTTEQLYTSGSASMKDIQVTLKTAPPLLVGNSQVIPSASDLRLVTINPGESAAIEFRHRVNRTIESLIATYCPEDHFNGRFGFWTGSTTSSPWKAQKNK